MIDYGLDFLKEKGFFESSINITDEYNTIDGTLKDISYVFDSNSRLAFFDNFDKRDITVILQTIRKKRNFDYYWFWKEGRLYIFRTFGENKQFIFNTLYSQRREYIKSKMNKLEKFSAINPESVFEVKDVISRFYRRLWDLRLKLAKAIKGDIPDKDKILIAQRIFDRLIFTYFIAEKGIIYGIDKRGRRMEVSSRRLYDQLVKGSDDFYALLNDLFFDYLNNPNKNDMPIKGFEGYSLFVPYLNGGLFRERLLKTYSEGIIKESEIEINGFDWKELIDSLNEYNWIIDDYTSSEDETAIGTLTPEILGHIYEKFVISVSELNDLDVNELKTTNEGDLKKGNKKIGAYYTPEFVTKYIAEKTIFPFVMDKLELNNKFVNFDKFYDSFGDNSEKLIQFDNILKNIKILDPAVGSGAFLMAAADILFDWRHKCSEMDSYQLRREIIINNLHGVDLMEGAIEICMLRLWLWLIAAADPNKKIEPLPNIDFNIFEGNSLIGYSNPKEITEKTHKRKQKTKTMSSLKQFTISNWDEESIFELFKLRNGKVHEYTRASGKDADILREEIKEMTEESNKLLNIKLLKELNEINIDVNENDLKNLKPFHWVMEFSDVIENGGFDVIIGNPPYGNLLNKTEKSILYSFKTNDANEISANFIEQQIRLLKLNGFLGNITTGAIIINDKTTSAHEIIRHNMSKSYIAFFNTRPAKIFDGVEIRVSIILGKKDKPIEEGIINTTTAIKFTKEEKETILKNLSFESTEGLFLGSKIGHDGKGVSLPKIGCPIVRSILLKLKFASDKKIIKNRLVVDSENKLEFRKTGRYWLNALPKMPYESTKIEELCFPTSIERDFCILLINSSTFYLYWSTYGNLRDLPKSLVEKFPMPQIKRLREDQNIIIELKEKISTSLLESFDKDKGSVGEFDTAKCKTIIDEIDQFIGNIFDFTQEEIEFIKTYDQHIRPSQ